MCNGIARTGSRDNYPAYKECQSGIHAAWDPGDRDQPTVDVRRAEGLGEVAGERDGYKHLLVGIERSSHVKLECE